MLFVHELTRPPSLKIGGQIVVEALSAEPCRLLINAQMHYVPHNAHNSRHPTDEISKKVFTRQRRGGECTLEVGALRLAPSWLYRSVSLRACRATTQVALFGQNNFRLNDRGCLLYTSPSPRD